MNWSQGMGNKLWFCGNYRVEILASPAYHFCGIFREGDNQEKILKPICKTADEAKAVCAAHNEKQSLEAA